MKNTLTSLVIAALFSGCGGGGSDPAAPTSQSTTTTGSSSATTTVAATPAASSPAATTGSSSGTTSSGTASGATSGTTVTNAPSFSETTGLWSGDTIGGKPITDQALINRFAAARAAESQEAKTRDDTKYPSAGNASFTFFMVVTADSPAFKTYGTDVIVGSMKSLTAARLAPCVIEPSEYKLVDGDCNLAANIEPFKYVDSTKKYNCTLFYTWELGGNIEYCVPRT